MASAVASASPTIFESLPARPPTPPREAQHDPEASAKAAATRASVFEPDHSLQTPPNANTAAINGGSSRSNIGSSRLRKKVEWSAHTDYKDAVSYNDTSKPGKLSPPSAPPSAQSKPVKGILKPSSSPLPPINPLGGPTNGHATQTNIIEMLDSTIKQLAGADRHSRLDAYMMLARALKASNNLPDRVALQDKMSLFMQFIQRDVNAKGDNAGPDTSLINHALSLLATFLQFPAIASTLTADFGIFIVDHATRCFEDESVPKDVVRHLMQVVAFQNFSAKVMTSERVGRLILALHRIENHMTGKGIIMSRIHIYKRLVKQCRVHMITHTDWIKDLFTDLLSSIKEIRTQAVALGSEAGFSLRSEKQLMLKATEIFQSTYENETYIEFYIKKLQDLIKDRQTSATVPQTWGVIVLFLRCPLDRWQHYGPWLTLVQSAFNMADATTKQEANFAWNRYIYLSILDTKISPKALGTLCQPLLSQLKRKTNPKQPQEALRLRNIVIGGICNLFYYAFAPGNEKYPPSMVWDVAVQPIVNLLISLDGKADMPKDCLIQAANLVEGLLDVSVPKVWRADRILDVSLPSPSELPAIDSKWTRRHSDKILPFITPILEKSIMSLSDQEGSAFKLWQAFVGSIAAASAKDIKMSDETSKFLAAAFGLLSKLWSKGVPEDATPEDCGAFLNSIKAFVSVLIQKLGVLPFSEKRFSATVSDTFEPIATPSQGSERTQHADGVVRVPLHHLFIIFSSAPPGIGDGDALAQFFQAVLQPFFKDRTPKGRTDLSKELLQLIPRNALCPWGPWMLAAQNMCLPQDKLVSAPNGSSVDVGHSLGPSYRDMVLLLERGLSDFPNLPLRHWHGLFNAISVHSIQQIGHAGQTLALLEPLAKSIMEQYFAQSTMESDALSVTALKAVSALLLAAQPARDAQAINSARQRLWGTPISASRNSTGDAFDAMYKLCNRVLELIYAKLPLEDDSEVSKVIDAVTKFLQASFPTAQLRVLANIQSGLCPIIQDEAEKWADNKSQLTSMIYEMWDEVCIELIQSAGSNKNFTQQIEPLFMSAFRSKHGDVINKAADAWNKLAKDEDSLECSDNLKSTLSSLQSKLDLVMPGANAAESGAQANSLGNASFIALSSASSQHDNAAEATPTTAHSRVPQRSSSRRRTASARKEAENVTKVTKAASTPRRLRHENSQLRFAHIASSSPMADESQHLTERQKEVRSRQRNNAGMYSDLVNSSPTKMEIDDGNTGVDHKESRPYSTPKRGSSFSKVISLTPTPRRGQFLQMDDDPPSSPPLPRPDPLQSEIQLRSRGSSVVESWQFSSPPGSPVVQQSVSRAPRSQPQKSKQDAPAEVAQSQEEPTGQRVTRSRRHTIGAAADDELVIPSSIEVPEAAVDESVRISRRRKRQQPASSPLKASGEVLQTPTKSSIPELRRMRSNPGPVSNVPEEAGLDPTPSPANARGRRASRRRQTMESITTTEPILPPAAAPELPEPALVIEVPKSEPSQSTELKRKRKRPARQPSRSRKRRSVGGLPTMQTEESIESAEEDNVALPAVEEVREVEAVVASEPLETPAVMPRPTRGSSKRRRTRTRSRGRKSSGPQSSPRKEEGDTDEEIFSQLTNESNAMAQSQAEHEQVDVAMEDIKTPIEELTPRAQMSVPESEAEVAEAPTSILSALEKGLSQLRGATLSRDEVYKMEDMLMDMKRELYAAEQRGRGTDSLPPGEV